MEAMIHGLVIPKISFVNKVEDTANGDDSNFDYGMLKRYRLVVQLGQGFHSFEDNDKEWIENIREEIVEKINEYYRDINIDYSGWHKESKH